MEYFKTISIATTTGFSSQNYSNWPAAIPVFLIMVSFIGACVGSTGGGIKSSSNTSYVQTRHERNK